MSRSYKKFPGICDTPSKKFGKNLAARKVRHYIDELSNGGSYKKLFEQWDISDYDVRFYSDRHLAIYIKKYFDDDYYTGNNDKYFCQLTARFKGK